MSPRAAVLVFSALGCAVAAAAQTAPPRDQLPSSTQTGSAAIRGRVVAATGRPLRRAQITLSAINSIARPRTTNTAADGRYQFKDVPAGSYLVSVTRSGYLPLRFGQRRPLEQGVPLEIRAGQIVDNIDFTLPRSGVISGRITDDAGDPVAGVMVFAMRPVYFEGRRQLALAGGTGSTDDAGRYRLTELVPGTYFIKATSRETWTVRTRDGRQQSMGFAPTYLRALRMWRRRGESALASVNTWPMQTSR